MRRQLSNRLCLNIIKKIAAVLSGALVFAILFGFFYMQVDRLRKTEQLALSKTYTAFQSEMTQMIERNIFLLQGYLSYIETQNLTEKETSAYLAHLAMEDMRLIRSVSVLQDTTITFVYPKEGNESAIGTDLATVEKQKDDVLDVKQNHRLKLYGPQDLVQGGEGFIVRIPIMRHEDEYWGQLSLVMDADEFRKRIHSAAFDNNLKVSIINNENEQLIYNGIQEDKRQSLSFEMKNDYLNWTVCIVPKDGWPKHRALWMNAVLFSLFMSLVVTSFVYWNMYQKQRFKQLASRDFLTGLYNRHHLDLVQEQWSSSGKGTGYGIIMLDLNAFKSINDTYGHKIGDYVLRHTANQLMSIFESKDMVFRIGGDEFLVVIPEIEGPYAMEKYEQLIKKTFKQPFREGAIVLDVTPAIGSAIYPINGDSLDEVMSVADVHMYEDKRKR